MELREGGKVGLRGRRAERGREGGAKRGRWS